MAKGLANLTRQQRQELHDRAIAYNAALTASEEAEYNSFITLASSKGATKQSSSNKVIF